MTGQSPSPRSLNSGYDVVCFSHLRWDFVYQRPQHLMGRFARRARVFYVEEPIFDAVGDRIEIADPEKNVCRLVPHLTPEDGSPNARVRTLLSDALERFGVERHINWFYTP